MFGRPLFFRRPRKETVAALCVTAIVIVSVVLLIVYGC